MGKRKFSDEDYKKWAELYQSGLSTDRIAKLCGVSVERVCNGIKRIGVNFRKPNWSSEYDNWKSLYLSGMSAEKIANLYGCCSGTVLNALKKIGIKTRTQSEANRIYQLDEHYFDVIDTDRKAYFLGFICADGCIASTRNCISLCLHKKDYTILSIFREELHTTIPIHSYKDKYVMLQVNSEHMRKTLISYGIVPNKTFVLRFPEIVPEKYYYSFVRGYFDGDGCICITKNGKLRWVITSGSREILESIQDILVTGLVIKKIPIVSYRNAWRLQYGGKYEVEEIYKWLYNGATIYLPRKKAVFEQVFGGEELQKGGELKLAREI